MHNHTLEFSDDKQNFSSNQILYFYIASLNEKMITLQHEAVTVESKTDFNESAMPNGWQSRNLHTHKGMFSIPPWILWLLGAMQLTMQKLKK